MITYNMVFQLYIVIVFPIHWLLVEPLPGLALVALPWGSLFYYILQTSHGSWHILLFYQKIFFVFVWAQCPVYSWADFWCFPVPLQLFIQFLLSRVKLVDSFPYTSLSFPDMLHICKKIGDLGRQERNVLTSKATTILFSNFVVPLYRPLSVFNGEGLPLKLTRHISSFIRERAIFLYQA